MDINLGLAILGILIALYQGFEKRKLSRYLRSQAWYIYSMSLTSWGSAQNALKKYKDTCGERLNPEVFENLSKCDAYNFSLSLEAIRQIQFSEPRFDIETIMTWGMQGKIPKDHTPLFLRILSLNPPNMFSLFWKTLWLKLHAKLQNKLIQQPSTIPSNQKDSEPKKDVGKS